MPSFITTIRFLQTEHYEECCVQVQEWRQLWNGHVHAQKMPGVSAQKVQGNGDAGWMWVSLTGSRPRFLFISPEAFISHSDRQGKNYSDELLIILHQFSLICAVHVYTLYWVRRSCQRLPWWALIFHSDMAGWMLGYWMSHITQQKGPAFITVTGIEEVKQILCHLKKLCQVSWKGEFGLKFSHFCPFGNQSSSDECTSIWRQNFEMWPWTQLLESLADC